MLAMLRSEATPEPILRPQDFPLGSVESRAAARALLAHRFNSRKRLRIIWNAPRPYKDNSRVSFSDWMEWPNGYLVQWVCVPQVWLKPGDKIPNCPDCGTPFAIKKEFPGIVSYEANCLDNHDPELLAQSARATAHS